MKKIILSAIVVMGFTASGAVSANGNSNNNNSAPEACSVSDFSLTSTPAGFVDVVGCAGSFSGNDETNGDWLEDLNVWQENGDNDLLTNSNGGTTDQSWTYLTKYQPNGTIESGEPNIDDIFTVEFSNCIDKDNPTVIDVDCSGDDTVALNIDITFNVTASELLYNQFVFSSKAGNYFSLYQVQVLEGIESITGTLSMVNEKGLSHLTVYASSLDGREPQVEVNAPATAGLLLTGLIALRLRRKS